MKLKDTVVLAVTAAILVFLACSGVWAGAGDIEGGFSYGEGSNTIQFSLAQGEVIHTDDVNYIIYSGQAISSSGYEAEITAIFNKNDCTLHLNIPKAADVMLQGLLSRMGTGQVFWGRVYIYTLGQTQAVCSSTAAAAEMTTGGFPSCLSQDDSGAN